jgi:sporulation-control protein spo0M
MANFYDVTDVDDRLNVERRMDCFYVAYFAMSTVQDSSTMNRYNALYTQTVQAIEEELFVYYVRWRWNRNVTDFLQGEIDHMRRDYIRQLRVTLDPYMNNNPNWVRIQQPSL